ncbi:hypothetical protein HNY73_007592 [Argiope bruennichi]|uniref:Uncharacterized protein n=1 Tax=Argiope bruennichi TaxID=94029 RepID=A0A8T0FHG6_ARGBR|nr:hypothetical protein HNY73_007592 [Argiope bruennichi]
MINSEDSISNVFSIQVPSHFVLATSIRAPAHVANELKFHRTKTGVPIEGISTRERIFGIPYDPRKDFAVPVPQRDIDLYLKENYDNIQNPVLKDFVSESCCLKECSCILGSNCRCRRSVDKKEDTS